MRFALTILIGAPLVVGGLFPALLISLSLLVHGLRWALTQSTAALRRAPHYEAAPVVKAIALCTLMFHGDASAS